MHGFQKALMIDDTFDLLETSNDLVAHNTKKSYNMLTLIVIFMKKFKEKEKTSESWK